MADPAASVDPPRPDEPATSALRRVAKNSAIPLIIMACNRLLDFGLALVMFRELGPSDVGRYTWLILVVGYFDLLISFGLGSWLTRELARNPAATGHHVAAAALLRISLWGCALGAALLIAGPLAAPLSVTPAMGLALVALTVGIGISNLSGLFSAVFSAREQMEYPAIVSLLTAALKVALGSAALMLGWGIIGLAWVSVITNAVTGIALAVLSRKIVGPIRLRYDARFSFGLLGVSYVFFLNSLLSTVFFRVDGLLLRGIAGDTQLGWYSAAYRFIDSMNIIPASLTLALFPLLARLAVRRTPDQTPQTRGAGPTSQQPVLQAATVGLRVLLAVSLPIAAGATLVADPLVRLVAGEQYLPHAAIALQILIWFLPFSFVNGLLQQILLSFDRQRVITLTLLTAVSFNVVSNLLFMPQWGYLAAAVNTVLSELILLGPSLIAAERHAGRIHLLAVVWRPACATALMAATLAVGIATTTNSLAWIPVGISIYAVAFVLVRGIRREEWPALRDTLRRR